MTRPITPDEAEELDEFDEVSYNALVTSVNRHLKGGGRTLQRSLVDQSLFTRFIEDFESSGWEIEHVHDPRDGDYLVFRRMVT